MRGYMNYLTGIGMYFLFEMSLETIRIANCLLFGTKFDVFLPYQMARGQTSTGTVITCLVRVWCDFGQPVRLQETRQMMLSQQNAKMLCQAMVWMIYLQYENYQDFGKWRGEKSWYRPLMVQTTVFGNAMACIFRGTSKSIYLNSNAPLVSYLFWLIFKCAYIQYEGSILSSFSRKARCV